MKRLLLSGAFLLVLSVAAALVTYRVVGPPDRSVACDPADLPEHHVCLSTVREWPEDEVLWVDARPREKWQEDGVEGSILINDQEEWMMMVPELIGQMAIAPRPRVVVYCDQEGCGSSKYVANQLRKEHAGPLGFEVFVLYGGIAALREEKR